MPSRRRKGALGLGSWVGAWALLAILVSPPVGAAGVTGTELLAECSATPGSPARKLCVGYIAGVVDGIDTLLTTLRLLHPLNNDYPRLYCLPPGTVAATLVAPTIEYLRKHPATRHYGASSEVVLALKQTYPCVGS